MPERYNKLLISLHWIGAVFLILILMLGTFLLAETPSSDPEKLIGLRVHMSIGIGLLVLFITRFIVRLKSHNPPHAKTGNAMLDKLGVVVHYVLYALVIAMAASGMAMANMAGLPEIVFGGSGAPLPESFDIYPPRAAHGFLALALMGVIALHVAGWIFHQYILRDRLFSRMWFGSDKE